MAYMLVYMLKSFTAEVRSTEVRELMKRDAVRRKTIQMRHASVASAVKTGIPPELVGDGGGGSSGGGGGPPEPGTLRGVKRKLSTDSSAEDYSNEYSYSNCRVFPVKFQPHLRNKVDKDNLEFDEEINEKKQQRIEIVRRKNREKRKMREMYTCEYFVITFKERKQKLGKSRIMSINLIQIVKIYENVQIG